MQTLNQKTFLVTGGAGAIGINLVNELKRSFDCKIFIVDNLSSGNKKFLDDFDIEFIEGDINNELILENVFTKKIDIVFHLAANFANQNSVDNPLLDLKTNVSGTLLLLEYCKKYKVDRFIYTNTSCMYSEKSCFIEDSNEFEYHTPYSISKHSAEKYVMWFYDYHGLSTTSLRIFNSYGPYELGGKYRNVIPNFIELALDSKSLNIMGDGTDTRSFTYVDDITRGLIKCVEEDNSVGQVINLGSSNEITILELANKINYLTGNSSKHNFIDKRNWDRATRRKPNISKSERLLNFKPETSIDVGLRKTVEWFKSVK